MKFLFYFVLFYFFVNQGRSFSSTVRGNDAGTSAVKVLKSANERTKKEEKVKTAAEKRTLQFTQHK